MILPQTHNFVILLAIVSVSSALVLMRLLGTTILNVESKPTWVFCVKTFSIMLLTVLNIVVGGIALAASGWLP